jgi:hypothetical protein
MKGYVVLGYRLSVSAAALSLALLAAPAFAQGIDDATEAGLAKLGIQAPATTELTSEQVAQINNVLGSTDSDSAKRMRIEGILGNEATSTGRLGVRQMQDSVSSDLAALGIDTEGVEMLTLTQLSQIQNITSSQDPDDIKKMRVEEVMGGQATATGRLGVNQLQDSAAAELADLGVDAEVVATLTISQLGQIENVMSSSDSDETKRMRIQQIVGE